MFTTYHPIQLHPMKTSEAVEVIIKGSVHPNHEAFEATDFWAPFVQ